MVSSLKISIFVITMNIFNIYIAIICVSKHMIKPMVLNRRLEKALYYCFWF